MRSNPPDESPRAYRFRAGLPAEVHCGGSSYPCDAENLSRTGVLLVGDLPGSVDGTVHLTLKSVSRSLVVSLPGRIVRTHDGRLAVEFADLSDREREDLEMLLSRVIEGGTPRTLENLRIGMPPHDIRKALEAIPLKDRISAAAKVATPQEREILRMDTHPQVLQALVRNPNLALVDARALAAHPQVGASVLEAIAVDPRFRQDDELKLLIVANPLTPPPLAESMLSVMKVPMLRRLVARPGLAATLKDRALKRIRTLLG